MILRIYPQNPAEREIRRVVEALLERDGVVVYPTDSVYAYGCSLRSARGLERLRQLSGKQTGELSIICDGISRAAEYCRVDNAAFKILKRNLPGSDHLPARRIVADARQGVATPQDDRRAHPRQCDSAGDRRTAGVPAHHRIAQKRRRGDRIHDRSGVDPRTVRPGCSW